MKTINLTIPTCWNELPAKQIRFVCRLFNSPLDHETVRQIIFYRLAGIRPVWYKELILRYTKRHIESSICWFYKGRQRFSITSEQLHFFLKKIDFLFTTNDLTENKFPVIKALGKKRYGPSSKCYNITLHEFIFASSFSFRYSKTKEAEMLNKLCAVLYRQKATRKQQRANPSENRVPFNDFNITKQSRFFRHVSSAVRTATFIFFNGSVDAMMKKFTNLFSGSISTSEPKNPVPGLIDSVKLLAGFDPTKDEKIMAMQVWQAFEYLDTIIERNRKTK
jgi:hypothetical protein